MALPKPEHQQLNLADQFKSLDEVIVDDEGLNRQTEASVIDSNAATNADTTRTPENLPAAEATKYNKLDADVEAKGNVVDSEVETKDKTTSDAKEEKEEGNVVDSPETEEDYSEGLSPEDSFNFLKENNILVLPEDFKFDGTEESLNKAIETDQQMRNQQALSAIQQKITDPRVYSLIEHGIKGSQFSDLEGMFNITKEELKLDTLDITKEPDAEKLLRKYYKEVAKFPDKMVQRHIDNNKMNDTLSEDAKEALDYYKKYYQEEKVKMTKEVEAKKVASEHQQRAFESQMVSAVKEAKYSGEVVKGIVSLLSPVADDKNKQVFKENGEPMYWYEAMLDSIRSNPAHMAQYLAMLNEYDDKEGFKKTKEREHKAEESNKAKSAFDSLNALGNKKKKGGNAASESGQKPFVPTPRQQYDV